jgi:hypothetical protein
LTNFLPQVKDRTEKYVQTSHKTLPVVESVEEVLNDRRQLQWLEAQRDMIDPTHKSMLFHGTSKEGVDAICAQGFKLPPADRRNMFGQVRAVSSIVLCRSVEGVCALL